MTAAVLVDSNVLIDVATSDELWCGEIRAVLVREVRGRDRVINPRGFAEGSR